MDGTAHRTRMQNVVELKRRVVEQTSNLSPREDVAERFRAATAGWGPEERLDLLCALVFVDPFAPFSLDIDHRDLVDCWARLGRLMGGDDEVHLVEAARRRSVVVDLVDGSTTSLTALPVLFGGVFGLLSSPVPLYGLLGTAFFGAPALAQRLAAVAQLIGAGPAGGVGMLGAGGALLAGAGATLLALDVPAEHLDLELKIIEIRARTAVEAGQDARLAQIELVLDQLLLDARARLTREQELNRPGAPRILAAERFVRAVSDLRTWPRTRDRPASYA